MDRDDLTAALRCWKNETPCINKDCKYWDAHDTCLIHIISDAIKMLESDETTIENQARLVNDLGKLLKEQETELCDRCGRRRMKSSREVKG